jgi:hypothetical protein
MLFALHFAAERKTTTMGKSTITNISIREDGCDGVGAR